MVGVGVSNDDTVDVLKRQATFGEAATYGTGASGKACVDEDGLPGIDQEGNPCADGFELEYAVVDFLEMAEHFGYLYRKDRREVAVGARGDSSPGSDRHRLCISKASIGVARKVWIKRPAS